MSTYNGYLFQNAVIARTLKSRLYFISVILFPTVHQYKEREDIFSSHKYETCRVQSIHSFIHSFIQGLYEDELLVVPTLTNVKENDISGFEDGSTKDV